MYRIFTYVWAIFGVNGDKYSIHGASGIHTKLITVHKLLCYCVCDVDVVASAALLMMILMMMLLLLLLFVITTMTLQ
jgi:hypothetical protein